MPVPFLRRLCAFVVLIVCAAGASAAADLTEPIRFERDLKVVCGHWSALGLTITQGVHAIDTGAVWGGKLTALQLDTDELRVVQVPGRDVPAPVPNARPPARPAHERPGAATQGKEQGGNAAATPGNRGPRRRRRRGGGGGGAGGGTHNSPPPQA